MIRDDAYWADFRASFEPHGSRRALDKAVRRLRKVYDTEGEAETISRLVLQPHWWQRPVMRRARRLLLWRMLEDVRKDDGDGDDD